MNKSNRNPRLRFAHNLFPAYVAFCVVVLPVLSPPAFSAGKEVAPPSAPPIPQQGQIINLNLLDALVTIKAQNLAGVFGFIPETAAAPALADYLLHDSAALKRFIKKGEKDLKEVGAIDQWDQQVYLYMVGILTSGIPSPEFQAASKKWMKRISALSLAPSLTLSEMTEKRKR